MFSSFASSFFRGVHGHFNGERPWALADECILDLMTELVGRCELQEKNLSLEMKTIFFFVCFLLRLKVLKLCNQNLVACILLF